MNRLDREDLTRQREAERETRLALRDALRDVIAEAHGARSRTSGTTALQARTASLDGVYGAVEALRRAEEAHDLAALDLKTAGGGDA